MDYEKKYKEALERAKEINNEHRAQPFDVMTRVFSELKKSEDEKTREEIISALKFANVKGVYDKHIAWLEKQGEQKPVNEDAEKEKSNYVSGQFLYCKGSFNEFKEGESYWLEYIGNDTYVGRSDNVLNQKFHITPRQLYTWLDPRHPEHPKEEAPMSYGKELESKLHDACARYYSNGGDTISLAGVFYAGVEAQKEIEQKPVDKVEPKFKVGDCPVNDYCRGKVIALTDDDYILDTEQGIPFSCEHNVHLWTIQDAKDGDVLAFDNGTIVIFKDLYNSTTFHSYCHIEDGIFDFSKEELPDWWEGEGFKPATKEQRDLLFQKMKEAGYTFDFEKKELKKIEIITPLFNVGDTIIKKHNSDINDFGQFTITDITGGKYWYNDRIICDITGQDEWEIYETNKQNAWSEEDEKALCDALWAMKIAAKIAKDENDMGNIWYAENWLKSLKDRMKVQWKPSEEQMDNLCRAFNGATYQVSLLRKLYQDLKNE